MTGEHGSCGCHHDDQHVNHDQHDADGHAEQAPAGSQSAGCCGGGASHVEMSRSSQHVQPAEPARRSS